MTLRRATSLLVGALTCVLAFLPVPADAQHRWYDADGNVHYWHPANEVRSHDLMDRTGRELEEALALEPDHREARAAMDRLIARGWKSTRR